MPSFDSHLFRIAFPLACCLPTDALPADFDPRRAQHEQRYAQCASYSSVCHVEPRRVTIHRINLSCSVGTWPFDDRPLRVRRTEHLAGVRARVLDGV